MKTSGRTWALILIIVLITIVLVYVLTGGSSSPSSSSATGTGLPVGAQTVQATYVCDGGKTIGATYINNTSATTTGNEVMLTLSDGRQMTLEQTVSADGARYSNGNPQLADGQPGAETFVFWSKGNGAIVEENGTSSDYTNCSTQTQ